MLMNLHHQIRLEYGPECVNEVQKWEDVSQKLAGIGTTCALASIANITI